MKLLLLALLALINSCMEDLLNDDKLSIQKTPYMGNQLKIDGYYYNEYANGSYRTAVFFYENGVILDGGGFPINELEKQEEDFKSAEWISINKEYKYNWGVFNIEGNTIKFERWYPSEPPLKAYVREGEILNDTTFIIKESYRIFPPFPCRNGDRVLCNCLSTKH